MSTATCTFPTLKTPPHTSSRCPNVRNQIAHPTAVVYARTSADVAETVKCAAKWNVKVSAASGRHSFNSAAVMDGMVVVDLSNMTQVNLSSTVTTSGGQAFTAWTGAGITNALLVAELFTKGPKGVASLSGSCPSVGTGGYYLGGGMGMLSPMYGLGCDQVVAIEIVLANGTVVTADASHHSDLLWASCGGGPGLGIVTRYKVKVPVHEDPRITRFSMFFPAANGNMDAISKWQQWVAAHNSRNGLMMTGAALVAPGMGGAEMAGLASSGMYLGPKDAATEALMASGLLESGAVIIDGPQEYATFGHFMMDEYMRLMNDWNWKLLEQEIGHGWNRSNPEHFDKFLKLALQPGSLVSSAEHRFWRWFVMNACYMVPELSPAALKALMDFQASPTEAECGAAAAAKTKPELSEPIDYLCLAKGLSNGIAWNHLLGGAVAAVPQDATAFPHRKMISPLCHEPSMPYGTYDSEGQLLPSANLTVFGMTVTYKPALLLEAFTTRIKLFQSALLSTTPNAGTYYNYILPSLEDWQHSYWGANYPRLQRVKAAYDPREVFSKPYTVEKPAAPTAGSSSKPSAASRSPRYPPPSRRTPPPKRH